MPDKNIKEEHRREREDVRGIENCFKLGIGNSLDKMLEAVTGNYHTPSLPNEPDKITKPISNSVSNRRVASINSGNNLSSYAYEPTVQTSKYAEVIGELERFRFADDDEKRKKQLTTVAAAIRDALQGLIIQDVAQNTKEAFNDHVGQFFKINGGLKVIYNFDQNKVAISARGAFFGDEVVYVYRDGGKIKGGVARIRGTDDVDDLSTNFSITVEKA